MRLQLANAGGAVSQLHQCVGNRPTQLRNRFVGEDRSRASETLDADIQNSQLLLQLRQRAFFVDPYQATRARDIRRQNSRQSPLYVLAAQDAPPGGEEIELVI